MAFQAAGTDNLLLVTDSYKITHHLQYPPKTTTVYSYFESRGGKFPTTVFFGLQYIIKRWLLGQVVTEEKIQEAKEIYDAHFGNQYFNEDGWRYILKASKIFIVDTRHHENQMIGEVIKTATRQSVIAWLQSQFLPYYLIKMSCKELWKALVTLKPGGSLIQEQHNGFLPLRIKAVPEGSVIPFKNVLFTVENTDPQCFWLTNYFETLLVQVWYPMTVATNSFYQKEIIARYLEETAETMDKLPFMLHDFGFRGSTSVESAGIGGCAHLVNFTGTDTIAAILTAKKYYYCDMAGFSIPAAEHSTITTWGRDGEAEAFRNMLDQFPTGLVACVSDSYNIWEACKEIWGKTLKEKVEKRDGTLVVRPDSGDPPEVVVKVLDLLGVEFGTTTNAKGYKELPSCIRIIQGDGISYESLDAILTNMKKHKWSAENIVFGSGGALLQRLDRDTQKCAYKCSYVVTKGKHVNVFKQPITDTGKKSKKGILSLELDENNKYVTKEEGSGDPNKDILETVFENGKLLRDFTFEEIRQRAKIPQRVPEKEGQEAMK